MRLPQIVAAAPMGQPYNPPKWVSSPRWAVGLSYHGSRKISDFHATAIVLCRKKPYLCTKLIDNAIQSSATEIAACCMARL